MRNAWIAFLCLCCALPLRAALIPGPERPVTPPNYSGTLGYAIGMATDGTDFLTLWVDTTTGRKGIYATIVAENGATRPYPPPVLLAGEGYAQAVWTGNAYLVLLSQNGNITAVRLDRDGQMIGSPSPVDLTGTVYNLAWNGHVALAVVQDPYGPRVLAFVDASGQVVRSQIALVQSVAESTAAAAGDTFVVAWTRQSGSSQGLPFMSAYALRVSGDGIASSPFELVPVIHDYLQVTSASGDDEAAIAVDDLPDAGHRLWRFTIDASSVHADPMATLENYSRVVRVVRTPQGFAASYFYRAPGNAVYLNSIAFGSATRRSVLLGSTGESLAAMETNGNTVLVVWPNITMSGARFDAALTQRKGEITPVAIAAATQSTPSIATAGDVAMDAWVEPNSVMLRRFDRAGNALDAQPLSLGGYPSLFEKPAVVFTGKLWLVAWQSRDGFAESVMMQRISPDGAVLDNGPIEIGEGGEPALAWNGSIAALVFRYRGTPGIGLLRFNANGERIDDEPITIRDQKATEPAVASNGEELLVTWTEHPTAPYLIRDLPGVFGIRLNTGGDPIDATAFAIANGPVDDRGARIASRGSDFVVAYYAFQPRARIDPPPPGPEPPIVYRTYTKRVLGNGTLADGFLLGTGFKPDITAAGNGYVVTFIDAEERFDSEPYAVSIFAVSTDANGAALAQPRTVLRATSLSDVQSVAAMGDAVWIAYSRMTTDLRVQRVFMRALAEETTRRRLVRP